MMEDSKIKRTGFVSLTIGIAAIIACELPIILAIIGLGGMGARATIASSSIVVEFISILFTTIGASFLTWHVIRKRKTSGNNTQ